MFPWKLASICLVALARSRGKIADTVFELGRIYEAAYKNASWDPRTNGEYWLLSRTKALGVHTVFDVGANRGEWSIAAGTRFPDALIHAFEIVPSTFLRLVEAVGQISNIRPYQFGLSSHSGIVSVNVSANDEVSSILDLHEVRRDGRSAEVVVAECEVRTGIEFCRQNGISQIDILKIDVEGAEHLVLSGFEELWNDGRIGLIQFEYGLANIYSRYLLLDFWRDFERRGYRVGKLMPGRVEFSRYSPAFEDFRGCNYVAVHKSWEDAISLLGAT